MGKPISERTHGKRAKDAQDRSHLTDEQVRANKVAGWRAKGVTRRDERRKVAESRPHRSPTDQLAHLNASGLVAAKERAKLARKLKPTP